MFKLFKRANELKKNGFKMSPQSVPLNFQLLSGHQEKLLVNIHCCLGFKWQEGRNQEEIWDN